MVYIDFFEKFVCKADKCVHSCCAAGWEIDIDEKTRECYKKMSGAIGEKVRESAVLDPEDGESAHFKMVNGKCPLLKENGLCELVLAEGEDELCDICSEHPRFYGTMEGFDYAGVGLCCEKSCELLLGSREPLGFKGEGAEEFEKLFPLRELEYEPEFSEESIAELLEIYGETEPIDEKWTKDLEDMRSNISCLLQKTSAYISCYDKKIYDRIYAYILFRQIEYLDECSWEELKIYALVCTDFVFLKDALINDTGEAVRIFSEQIEYCPENVDYLLELNRG